MSPCNALVVLLLCAIFSFVSASEITYDGSSLMIDGERQLILSGSIHYPRSTPQMWPSLIQKSKEGGLNAIETYVFWNAHEPSRRQYDFSGNLDLVRFIKTIQDQGLHAILRIGPYVCAEWNFGGFPVWLHNMPNITLRTNNEVFKNEMQNFTTLIVNMMKDEKLFASQGGPIILAQIENEYGNIMWEYGEDGKAYVNWCAELAQSYNIGVPWIMCQQDDAPEPMINTCNGFYCDQFSPNRKNSPKIWTENWSGWFKGWGDSYPHRPAEDLAFAVGRFFQYGGSLMNYYMYHGGTNFGHTSGGPYITTSYDYDAPLDEYGNLNQPKWGHLKELHEVLISVQKALLNGERRDIDYGNMMSATVYSYQGKSVCFLGNANSSNAFTVEFENTNYTVPAWSVTILPDCFTEAYNTAKVNSQTSIMVKKPNAADDAEEPSNLKWDWKNEDFEEIKYGTVVDSDLTTSELLDQKAVTNDTSDYLWYMTSIVVDEKDAFVGKNVTLQVNTSGHILHAFFNSKHIGSKLAQNGHYDFVFEQDVQLTLGTNQLSLLSATVGLPNYGANFDKRADGILGPVKLIDHSTNNTKDISSNEWIYKVGLQGQKLESYNPQKLNEAEWSSEGLPTNKMFVWYKTTFKTPLGEEPVVVDLLGLGKGEAWVNGKSIGPTYKAENCRTNCGEPSMRWYHIPREFLNNEENVLVLFEEIGGTPSLVNIRTITVGKVCANAFEGSTLKLSCQGGKLFSEIKFASFGETEGTCGSFRKGRCESANSLSVIEQACLGKESCSIPVTEAFLGPTGCHSEIYRLAVEAVC
ncbi:hypothetical protein Patl1_32313 [Pistacia atlantica]|uniref:Uncharacterized protein n=1 Tax=Pistacia atlantica TaxID=434234 RepID=A0ACC1AMS3_9ROSI|nr:hypothetical protein Patl1_32313 [Pistacia atlantica]